MILTSLLTIVGGVALFVEFFIEGKPVPKWAKVCVISGTFFGLVVTLIPSKETYYQMMAASMITTENINIAGDTITDTVDYIVDSIDKLLEENTSEEGSD